MYLVSSAIVVGSPWPGVTISGCSESGRHALVERHVARNGNLAIGQPRDDVAGAVGGAEVQKFDASVAQLDHVLVGEGDFRLAEPGEEGLVFQAVMCGGQDLGSAFDKSWAASSCTMLLAPCSCQ